MLESTSSTRLVRLQDSGIPSHHRSVTGNTTEEPTEGLGTDGVRLANETRRPKTRQAGQRSDWGNDLFQNALWGTQSVS